MVKLSALLLVAACTPASVDRSKVPDSFGFTGYTKTSVRCVPVRGAKAIVKMRGDAVFTGELLAADSAGLSLLEGEHTLRSLSARYIDRVDLQLYSTVGEMVMLTAWGVVGTASALTHGFFFVVSGPTWIGASLGTAVPVGADRGRFVTARGDLGRLYQFARFPAGLPDGYDPLRDRPQSDCD